MSNPLFRAWVESLPDETWAKKDLSACKLGWDAALNAIKEAIENRIVDIPNHRLLKTEVGKKQGLKIAVSEINNFIGE